MGEVVYLHNAEPTGEPTTEEEWKQVEAEQREHDIISSVDWLIENGRLDSARHALTTASMNLAYAELMAGMIWEDDDG
jgi:aspartate/tyrosine/aromatic aminotransferase